ncbi:hypothetical protein FRC14_004305 [Serendipita sp. 396]|nr:hypothetical protein FRC14_004305 [Serendipita sp. 396]KAG8782000.1 hypothetical protein FRC15_007756 [Serendipita sp. 397]KAG8798238.1 hypothetical protein FRC16_007649 [Serendipita sp. 398]
MNNESSTPVASTPTQSQSQGALRDGNSSLLTIVKAQLVFLLSTLTEENFEKNQNDIRRLSDQHGPETYIHFFKRLITATASRIIAPNPPASWDSSTVLPFRLLVQETQRLARDPFLADRFRDTIDKADSEPIRNFELIRFIERVALSPLERVILASAVLSAPNRRDLVQQASTIIRMNFDQARPALLGPPTSESANLSKTQIAKLLSNLLCDIPSDAPVLDVTQRQSLLSGLLTKYGFDVMMPIMKQILPRISLQQGTTLAQALIQLGPELTTDVEVVRALFLRYDISESNPPTDLQLLEVINRLARSASEGSVLPDVKALVRAFNSYNVQLQWDKAIRVLDRPERTGIDTATLKLIVAILSEARHGVSGFWHIWTNPLYQLRLIDALLSLPADTFSFYGLPGRTVVTMDDVANASPTIKGLAQNVQNSTWNSLDLFELLVKLDDTDNEQVKAQVREMLDRAVRVSAELVHMGLLQVPKPWNALQREYSNRLLTMFLAGHPNHQLVFMRIWQIDQQYLLTAFRDHYNDNPINITRILDVAQDLKILEALLEVQPFAFALDVAALASRREYLNLDKWLADHTNTHGMKFIKEMVQFLKVKIQHEQSRMYDMSISESRMMLLNAQTVSIFLRAMKSFVNSPAGGGLTAEEQDNMLEVRNICLQAHPRLMSLLPNSDVEPGTTVIVYAPEIEAEVEAIYRKLYAGVLSVEDLLAVLDAAKRHENARDHEIFAGVLHTVFDEYKFYPEYPPRELRITAQLFGSLIQNHLVEGVPLGIAIRCVITALNDPKLFSFGVQSLARFLPRLVEFPGVCHDLLAMQHLTEAQPDMVEQIRKLLRYAESGAMGENGGPPVFSSILPDDLEMTVTEPPEEVSDKILFIINNLALSNLDSKTNEMKECYSDDIARWFARYLVEERVSTELNNHPLYLQFLDALAKPLLFKSILHETYVKSARLLNDENTLNSAQDRVILKNLGSWLGRVTLEKNKPIKYKNLSLKDLLLEGYDCQRLMIVIPFACKILEGTKQSSVFKPPYNPWLMPILGLLVELYFNAELKLNQKFEIEVLFKDLDLIMDEVIPTSLLNARARGTTPGEIAQVGTSQTDSALSAIEGGVQGYPGDVSTTNGDSLTNSMMTDPEVALYLDSLLLEMRSRFFFEPELERYAASPRFLRMVQTVFEAAIRETCIVQPVVERSANVAAISAANIVSRDYSAEADENKLRRAAHNMVRRLAAGLALVTAKEVLRQTLASTFRQELSDPQWEQIVFPEHYLQLLIEGNLDLACLVIENVAVKRSIQDVDRILEPEYEARRVHRQQRPSQPFWNPKNPVPAIASAIPLSLRIRSSGVTDEQMRIYEELSRSQESRSRSTRPIPPKNPVQPFQALPTAQYAQQAITPPRVQRIEGPHHQSPILLTHEQTLAAIERYFSDFDAVWTMARESDTGGLPTGEDLIEQIWITINNSEIKEESQHFVCQKLVQVLLSTKSDSARRVYAGFLAQLQLASVKSAQDAVDWFLATEDKRKWNLPTIVELVGAGALNLDEYEDMLVHALYPDGDRIVIQFAIRLARHFLLREYPMKTWTTNFQRTLEVLKVLDRQGKAPKDEVPLLLEQLRVDLHTIATVNARMPAAFHQLYPRLEEFFDRWVRIFQGPSADRDFLIFANELEAGRVLKSDETTAMFFRVCMEASVNRYIQVSKRGSTINPYLYVDAFSRLIILMIKHNGEAMDKEHNLKRVLTIVLLVLSHQHEEFGPRFHQKPFFRFFSSLLSDLQSFEESSQSSYFPMLMNICETFHSLQPMFFPRFVFSWMALVSHRLFLPKMLISPGGEGWPAYCRLLVALFNFAGPVLKSGDPNNAVGLRQGVLRILLLLLHDIPEFLSANYFQLCEAIPTNCVQMRNIVLSAFPGTILLPDPHPAGQLEALKETSQAPTIASDYGANIKPADLQALDLQLLGRGTPTIMNQLVERVLSSGDEAGEGYNLSVMNSIVLYTGVSTAARAFSRNETGAFSPNDPGVTLIHHMATSLDLEGQHHLVSAIVLNLRFPSHHTFWFSALLLDLFAQIKDETFKEVVTKVLLERVLCHRPHPWGVVMTLIELIRDPKCDFFSHKFTRAYPEIHAMLRKIGTHVDAA